MHEQIRGLCARRTPNALLIPTATYDNPERAAAFEHMYGTRLGCNVSVLNLLGSAPVKSELRNTIQSADIIFVSGGNTLKLMRRWRRLGVDRLLLAAQRRGVILAGSSAGAICWYAFGHSDSMWYYTPEDWDYIRVKGLGIIPATCCPHVLAEGRIRHFQRMIGQRGGMGLGIDNDCAIAWLGNTYQVLTARRDAKAFRIVRDRGQVVTTEIERTQERRLIAELLG
jgi:dipeptidase E